MPIVLLTPPTMPLNSSCTECRSKRLRCDRNQPCSRCSSKGKAHLCQREARKPRGGQRPRPIVNGEQGLAGPSSLSSSSLSTSGSPSSISSFDILPDAATCKELLYIFERRVYTLVGACVDLVHLRDIVQKRSLANQSRDDALLCTTVVSRASVRY